MTRSKQILQVLAAVSAVVLATVTRAEDAAAGRPPPFSVKVTGTGRPMILIPGLSCGGSVWDGTVEHFKDHYECHVLTLAGFAGQPAINAPFLEQVRAGIEKYIREKKLDHPVIVGHSLGGFMAFWLAATDPQQVGPVIAVDGLPFLPALFNPDATPESVKPSAEQFRSGFSTQTPEEFAVSNRKALATMITGPANLDFVDASSKKSDPKAVGEAFYELMTADLRPQVKAIQSPVLLIGATATLPADQRTLTESVYRAQVSTIPHHQVVFAPKAKHFIQLDEPQFFYAQVESFLKAAAAPEAH